MNTRMLGMCRGRLRKDTPPSPAVSWQEEDGEAGWCSLVALCTHLTALLGVPAGRNRVWLHRGPPQRLPRGAGLPPRWKPEGLPSEAAAGEMLRAASVQGWGAVLGTLTGQNGQETLGTLDKLACCPGPSFHTLNMGPLE